MLSGFTSQLGTFIGKKATTTTESTEPLQPSSADNTTTPSSDLKESQEQSTTEGSSANPTTILTSVAGIRNHIPAFPSWFSGNKKPEEETTITPSTSSPQATPKVKSEDDDADRSSATGGADSDEQISEEEPGAAAAGGPGGLDKVKNLGNLLFSTIKGAGQKIKETSILGEFQREHESFLKSKGKGGDALVPWVGHAKEEALKEEILSLSNDRRNFVRSPPQGINFQWDYATAAPVAKAILAQDPNLETMRYTLVPKVITEENFWKNYFYRVQLLIESMDDTKPKKRRGSSSEEDGDGDDADLEKELNEELKSFEVVRGAGEKHDEREIDSLLDLKSSGSKNK